MNGEIDSLIALQLRKLVARHASGSPELADAMRQLLQGQRDVMIDALHERGGADVVAFPSRALRAVD